jgi:phosphopantetheinyl transferase
MCGNEDVIQRYASFDLPGPQSAPADAPDGDGWLSAAERRERDRWHDINRRVAWLAGRRLGKQLIVEVLQCGTGRAESCTSHPARIEILSRDKRGRGVRPVVTVDDALFPLSLSISHSTRGVLVALATRPGLTIGVDLAIPGEVRPRSLRTWFTAGERDRFDRADLFESATVWAIKEAVYKACHEGERFAPRQIDVFRCSRGGYNCRFEDYGDKIREITLSEIDGQIAVVVVANRPMRDSRGISTAPEQFHKAARALSLSTSGM